MKDRIVTWFIQYVIKPRREIIDKPGFIVTTFTEQGCITYLREIFLPEKLFEIIESMIVERYGDQGRQTLYSAGKKFGYLYSSMSNFPTVNTVSTKEFIDFAYNLMRYIEITFAEQANHEINLDEKMFTARFTDYVVCRHNGLGYILMEGGIAGIWSYALQDKSLEGIQLECQGKGNKNCYILCGHEKKIQEKTNKFFCERDLPEYKFDSMYKALNEIQPTKYTQMSMKKLLYAGFFEYIEGSFFYKKNRFFGCEAHILYLLEQEIIKLNNGEQLLFDICYEYGKELQEIYGSTDYQKFIIDFFSALGFGEVRVVDFNPLAIVAKFFPWSVYSERSKYIIFRGILSGFISKATGQDIKFNNFEITVQKYLTLTIKA